MFQLQILSGRMAGANTVARHFPFSVGRSPSSDLTVDEPGVWEDHLGIDLRMPEGFIATTRSEALMSVNGEPTHQATLRNGDLIELGALKIRFSLSATRHRGLRLRECLVWTFLVAITATQLGLIYWLLAQ